MGKKPLFPTYIGKKRRPPYGNNFNWLLHPAKAPGQRLVPGVPVRGHLQQEQPLLYRERHPGILLRRLEKHDSSLLLKMPICSITAPGPQEFPAARGRGGHFCSLRYRLTRLLINWTVSSKVLSLAKYELDVSWTMLNIS